MYEWMNIMQFGKNISKQKKYMVEWMKEWWKWLNHLIQSLQKRNKNREKK